MCQNLTIKGFAHLICLLNEIFFLSVGGFCWFSLLFLFCFYSLVYQLLVFDQNLISLISVRQASDLTFKLKVRLKVSTSIKQ